MKKKLRVFYIFLVFLSLFLFLLLFFSNYSYAKDSKIVIISKIKIIIDGNIYEWEIPDIIPQKNETNYTSPLTVISFLDIKPLDKIELKTLTQKLFNIERNLLNSGYFFTASAYFVQSSKAEGLVNVIIEVTEGFLLRFGGGSIFAVFGKENLYGLRKGYLVALGYNLDGIKYYDNMIFNSNFFLNTGIFYQNGYGFSDISFDKIDFELNFGYRIKPNLFLSLISFINYQKSTLIDGFETYFYQGDFFTFKEGLKIFYNYFYFFNDDKNQNEKADFFVRGEFIINPYIIYYFNIRNSNQNLPDDLIYIINIKKTLVLETKYLSTGFSIAFFYSSNNLDYFVSYNLSYSDNPFIRTLVSKSQAFADMLFVSNFEIRSREFLIPLGGIFNFVFSIFIFDDFAFCKHIYKNPQILPSSFHENDVQYIQNTIFDLYNYFLNAFGGGIRFGFAMPVNVYFTLTYGINLNKNGTIILFYGKGF
ncbi:MAG: hypothetical protein ACK4YF_04340 [Exilispira sp.]